MRPFSPGTVADDAAHHPCAAGSGDDLQTAHLDTPESAHLMKAARWYAKGDLRVESIPVPSPSAGEVLLKILWCGICGTDLEEVRDGPVTVPVEEAHPRSGRSAPLTLGHEMVGQIVIEARDGSGPPRGTIVIPDVVQGCGTCWWCAQHQEGLCPTLNVLGQTDDGGLAEYMVAKASRCVVVPATTDPLHAVLTEPTAVAVRAMRKVGRITRKRVLILGGGTIGQLIAQIARSEDAASILLTDPIEGRRHLAERLAAADTCTPDELSERLEHLPEPGIDVVFECTGRPDMIQQALQLVRRGGSVVCVGLRAGSESINVPEMVLGERHLIGSAAHMWDTDVTDALSLITSGQVNAGPLISHTPALKDIVSEGLEVLADPRSGALKVVVRCHQ